MTVQSIVSKYGGLMKSQMREDIETLIDSVIECCIENAKIKNVQVPDRFGFSSYDVIDKDSILKTKSKFI